MVAAALRRPDGLWLMHRRPAHKHHGGLWEFPGGKVETGESPAFAIVRELREELGITIEPSSIRPIAFAEEMSQDVGPGIVILLYSVEEWGGEARARDEGAAIDWLTAEAIGRLDRPPLDQALCAQIFANCGGIR